MGGEVIHCYTLLHIARRMFIFIDAELLQFIINLPAHAAAIHNDCGGGWMNVPSRGCTVCVTLFSLSS